MAWPEPWAVYILEEATQVLAEPSYEPLPYNEGPPESPASTYGIQESDWVNRYAKRDYQGEWQ